MATPEYDPAQPGQHAQWLFNHWQEGPVEELYDWLSRRNIDANVAPHAEITRLYRADVANEAEPETAPVVAPPVAEHLTQEA
jgi:hypothetical protein